jgi:hypothetical protein
VLNVFAPRNPAEFHRVLVGPDDSGVHRHCPVDVVVGVRRCQNGAEDLPDLP